MTWAQLRRGLRVRVSTKVRARVSLRLDRKGAGARWVDDPARTRPGRAATASSRAAGGSGHPTRRPSCCGSG